MKLLKKGLLYSVMIFALVTGGITVPAQAAEKPVVSLNAQHEDRQVVLIVSLDSQEDQIGSVQYTVKYDSSGLELKSAELQGAYRNMVSAVNTDKAGQIMLAAATATGVAADDTIMKIIFNPKVNDSTVNYAFSIEKISLSDEEGGVLIEDEKASAELNSQGGSGESGSSGNESSGGTSGTGSSGADSQTGSGDSSEEIVKEPFSDVNDHWAYDYIIKAYDMKLMQGYGNGLFGPDKNVTRAQMAVVLWNSAGNPKPQKEAPFTDLEADWYKDAVAWAAENGLVHGVGNGLYRPEGTLTREQLCQILFNKSGGIRGMEMMFYDIYDGQYIDSSQLSSWAKPAFYWSLYKEILCGSDSIALNNELNSKEPASRGQIAVMLTRYDEVMK